MPIVQATGIAVGNHLSGASSKSDRIEAAMLAAVKRCHEMNITDVDIMRTMIREAREAAANEE